MKQFILRAENRLELAQIVSDYLDMQSDDKLPLEVVVRPYRRNRSSEQNALYWKWLSIISVETGYTKDDLHDMLRYKLLGMQVKKIANHKVEYLPSTTKLKVGEMAEYLNQVEQWCNSLGIRLPYYE